MLYRPTFEHAAITKLTGVIKRADEAGDIGIAELAKEKLREARDMIIEVSNMQKAKANAIGKEDYLEAKRLKEELLATNRKLDEMTEQEWQISTQKCDATASTPGPAAKASADAVPSKYEDLELLAQLKKSAIEREDFDEAKRLKE